MSVKQISVFVESKPGHLLRTLALFESSKINVRGFSVSDTGDYGISRFIVDDYLGAKKVLEEAHAAFTVTDVICLKLEDRAGDLANVIKAIAANGINISYSYSMISTYIILSTDDIERTESILNGNSIQTIDQEELSNL